MPALPAPSSAPPVAPEIPLPDFPTFDLNSFPQFIQQTSFTPPMRTPSPFHNLPQWCPRIPSLTMSDIWRDSVPTFYDLSSLPEPKEPLEEATARLNDEKKPCMEVQLWQPPALRGREHSRFFPPQELPSNSTRPKAQVKLPANACKLHPSDTGIQAVTVTGDDAESSKARSYESLLIEHYGEPSIGRPVQGHHSQQTPKAVPDPSEQVSDDATAANLWRILDCQRSGIVSHATESTYSAIMTPLPAETPGELDAPTLFASREHFCQSPFELDGRELPYVHSSSLTGYCNANPGETSAVPDYQQQTWMDDFGIGAPTVRYAEDLTGLNELMVDHNTSSSRDFQSSPTADLPMVSTMTSPVLAGSSLLQELPADYLAYDSECTPSDAHFQSEQALFAQSPAVTPLSLKPLTDVNRSAISIGDFLKLGHARDCWCGFCSDQAETSTEDDASSTKVAVDDADSAISLDADTDSDSQAETPELISLDDSDAMTEADDGWLLYTDNVAAEEGRSDLYLPSSPVLHQPPESPSAPVVTVTSHPEGTVPELSKTQRPPWGDLFPSRPCSALSSSMASSATVESESDVDAQEWDEMWEGDLL